MDLDTTFWLLGAGFAVFLAALVGDRARRRAPLAWHAHLPWDGAIFAGAAVMLFGAVHLIGVFKAG
jgi:hypothetical protein